GVKPAGRSSRRIPSGVSLATAVSRTSRRTVPRSGFDNDGVGDFVVRTWSFFSKIKEAGKEPVERDDTERGVRNVAQPENASQTGRRAVRSQNFDVQQFLGH